VLGGGTGPMTSCLLGEQYEMKKDGV